MKLLPPPGPARRNQLAFLALMLVALAGVGWYEYGPDGTNPAAAAPPASNTRATAAATPAQAAPSSTGAPALPVAIGFGNLEPVPNEPASGRNPFRFGVPPAPPPPPPPPPVAYVAPPPAPPPGPPPIPPIQLKFSGVMELNLPEGLRKVAFLSDAQGVQYKAFEGQVVAGQYRVVKIGRESVIVEYADGTGRRTITMGG